jgi:Asp-tRNA(Asn)/Glu-tRNA(Gln) amidotransferase A subunit family amidase
MRADDLYPLLRRWDAFRSELLAFVADCDLILTPVLPEPARRHRTRAVPGEIDPTSCTTPHSLTGWLAATGRCGTGAPAYRSTPTGWLGRAAVTWRSPG